ncbi:hypothetical protein LEMLEM_LOCUS7009, partial [Lemmus lemmus]
WPCWSRCGLVGVGVVLLEEVWSCWSRCGLVGGGVVLLEEVWSCWRRKCVTVEVVFEVSYMLKPCSVSQSILCYLLIKTELAPRLPA